MSNITGTTFIGRSVELEGLLNGLPADGGHAQGFLKIISGNAGIGKSRLLAEIARKVESRGFRVLWSERIEDPGAPPFFTWVLALRSCLANYNDDELIHDLGAGAGDVADLVPELRNRLGLSTRQRSKDSVTARFQMFDSVSNFFLTSSKQKPLVLLLDNLHLADRSSLALLEYFCQQISAYPVYVIAAYRTLEPGGNEALKQSLGRLSLSARCSLFQLDGLKHDEVARLFEANTRFSLPASLIDAVYKQGDGNPLFVVEAARMLQRRSVDLPLPGAGFHFDVPESLRDIILARLAMLSANTRNALAQAAVLGRDFESHSWQAMVGQSAKKMLILTHDIEDSGIIHVIQPGHYRFQHALYREALYAQLNSGQRAEMHLAAARYFEQRWAEGARNVLSQLAYHYFEVATCGHSEKAVQFNREAAEAARDQRAYNESANFLEQALIAFELSPSTKFQARFDLLLAHGMALFRAGQPNSALGPLLSAASLAHNAQDWFGLADALAEFQFVCGQLGITHPSGLPLHQALLRNLPAKSQGLRVKALASMSDAHRLLGNADLAAQTATESMERARELVDPALRLEVFRRGNWALGCSSATPETLDYRLALSKEIQEIARVHGSAEDLLMVMCTISFNICNKSTAEELQQHMVVCRQLMESEVHPHYLNLLAGFEVSVNILQGKWDNAIRGAVALRQRAYIQDVSGLEGGFGQQMFVIQKARGQLAGAAALIKQIEVDADSSNLWLPGQILLHCEIENWPRARDLLHKIGDLNKLNHDGMYLASLVYLSEACVALNDRLRLIELYKFLKPFRLIVASIPGTVMMGAVAGYMASIAVQLGKKIRARELFEEAMELNSRMQAAPWLARVQSEYAQFLLSGKSIKDHTYARDLIIEARKIATEFNLSPVIAKLEGVVSGSDISQLTKRERTVLKCIAHGSSNKIIAAELSVSPNTIAIHVRNILRKLHVTNRTEAADFAHRSAWFE